VSAPHRYRPTVASHAPAAPRDHRRRSTRIPSSTKGDRFDWLPETELVVGVAKPKRSALDAVLDRAWPVGRSRTHGGTK
jgi:hypothetical protein